MIKPEKKLTVLYSNNNFKNYILIIIVFSFSFLLLFATPIIGQITVTDTYTSTSTWSAPSGVTSATVQCWGGGGAGGRSNTTDGGAGGGGAGGAYATSVLVVVPGTAYTVTVGASKASAASNTASNNTGNPSWFNTAGTIFAEGGPGGAGVTTAANGAAGTGSAALSIGTTTRAGGNGAGGNRTSATAGGAGGGGAGSTGVGGNATTGTAGTGTTLNGGNGGSGPANNSVGNQGNNYGGGGSGGKRTNDATNRTGGAGAQGLVTITYVVPNNAIFYGGNASGFYVSCLGTISEVSLPIELLSFSAFCNNKNITLKWSTATEINNDYFTIERSSDANNWIPIGIIKGANNSKSIINYSYTDTEPINSISYYRLKQTDFDGQYKYFEIVSSKNCLVNNSENNFTIYPNPANQLSVVSYQLSENSSVKISICDVLGKEVLNVVNEKQIAGEHTLNINTTVLQSGVYFVKMIVNEEQVIQKLIISK